MIVYFRVISEDCLVMSLLLVIEGVNVMWDYDEFVLCVVIENLYFVILCVGGWILIFVDLICEDYLISL